ncbi:MAG: hypothetical protein ACRD3A_06995 [Terriglobales bacterium]
MLEVKKEGARLGVLTVALLLVSAAWIFAEKQPQPLPKAFHAKTYPAHESHEEEKASIAVDPYDMPDKAAIFVVNYRGSGFLPMQFIISNDGDQPLSLVDMQVELITADRSKIPPATPDDLYRRLGRQTRRGDEPARNPLPVPLPRKKVKPTVSKEAQEEIESMQFRARAVEAHSLQSGFLIFDVAGIANPLAGAHLYVHGLRDQNGKELFYFEIPLEKYLTYRPGHP